ncbi:MAG TPA: glycosyltransferase family 4 protein [Thermoanaerobaculia bacterium]|nr:glycosyltransferase family 4 protein [Thermoanaerobaculia bacterium]
MRILLFSDSLYPEFVGGIERRNADLAAALGRRGHAVTLAGFGRSDGPSAAGVRVLSLGGNRPLYSAAGSRAARPAIGLARAAWRIPLGDYDAVETSNVPFVHLFPLAARCASAGKPLLVSWYEYWGSYWNSYAGFRAPFYRAVERVSAQIGDVVASSALTAGRLARRLRRDVPVVSCGTDVDDIAAAVAGVEEEPGRVIYAGRLLAHKRVDLLLDAVAAIPVARLVVYGEGPERESLLRRACGLGITARVEFRAPSPDRAELWREIGKSAVAAQPSSREGFGIFPLEALAAGVPVVYVRSEHSAVEEVVRHGIEGVRTEPDAAALARAIAGLLDDGPARRSMGARGRARAGEYRADRSAAAVEEVFERLLGRRRVRGGAEPGRRDSAA